MGARPRLRLGPCSLSVSTVEASGKTLYVKFHSTISVTFSEEKRGGAGESTLSYITRWRPPESHDSQSCVHCDQKRAYDTRADSQMLVQNSWFDTSTDNVTLAQS